MKNRQSQRKTKPSTSLGTSVSGTLVGLALACATFVSLPAAARAQEQASATDESAALAKKLANPIANLISVPVNLDGDTGIGAEETDRSTYVVQPVIPFSLNDDWNVITRTIVPFIQAESPAIGGSVKSGVGDITQSFLFSSKEPAAGGRLVVAGPVFVNPTATSDPRSSAQRKGGNRAPPALAHHAAADQILS